MSIFIITKTISEFYLDFKGTHSEYFVFCILSINNRHFLPLGRADLTTSAINKMSSRAKRGDLTKSCKMFKMARSLCSWQRSLLRCGSGSDFIIMSGQLPSLCSWLFMMTKSDPRPQLHRPHLAADDLYFNNIVVASGVRQFGNLDS